jgi:molecular chaperone GrpE
VGDSEQAVKQAQSQGAPGRAPGAPVQATGAGAPAGEQGGGHGGEAKAPAAGPHEAADEAALQGDVDELVAVAAQRDDYLALAQRTQADFENYRKRVAREASAATARGVAKLATALLPALDNFDRAIAEIEAGSARGQGEAGEVRLSSDGPAIPGADEDPLVAGLRLVRNELTGALSRMGVESFSPLGEQFDPAEHEAMAQLPPGQAQSGSVVEVYQPGYRMGETILRPARVVVAG